MGKFSVVSRQYVRIEKTVELDNLWIKHKQEKALIKEYVTTLILMCACLDVLFVIPILKLYGDLVQNFPVMWFFIGILCFVINICIDQTVSDFYWQLKDKENLKITNHWRSGSYEDFVALLEASAKAKLSLEKETRITLYDVMIAPSTYVCQVVVWR